MKSDEKKPRKRSPIPPPGYVMDKTSYDRSEQKEALEKELEEYQQDKRSAVLEVDILAGEVHMRAMLNTSETAQKLAAILPLSGKTQVWGKEIYFQIPMHAEPEDARAEVAPGTIAFWPDGDCLCIFFGQQPVSPVNLVGKVFGEPAEFEKVRSGDDILIKNIEK